MCGIVGGLRAETYSGISPEAQNEIMRIMTVELLLLTEERGSDATGFALLFEDGNMRGMKHGEKASRIVQDFDRDDKTNFLALMDIWKYYKRPANIVMGHCRKKTTGAATDNRNNHPFKVGNIFGIHNGHVENHFIIEKMLKEKEKAEVDRAGIVDSEMIFHLLNNAVKKSSKLTLDQAEWVVRRLQGRYAVMAANVNNPYQLMLFRDGKPIEVGLSRPAGLIFVASEKKFFETALFRYKRIKDYYGLDYLPDLELTVASMPDDHAWIFNLAKKIEKDTSINDLVEARKMPLAGARDRDWQTRTTVIHNNWRNNNVPANTTNKPAETDESSTPEPVTSGRNCKHLKKDEDDDDSGIWKPGRAWNRDTRKYEDKEESAGEKQEERRHTVLTDDEPPRDTMETGVPEDTVVVNGVEVKDYSTYVETGKKSGKERSRASVEKAKSTGSVKSVDAKQIVDDEKGDTLTELIKMYVKRYGHFKASPAALDAAEIKEERLLSGFGHDDFRHIASRIRKKAIAEGYEAGYNTAIERSKSTAGYTSDAMQKALVKQTSKKKKAEERIKKLKAFALYLAENMPAHIELCTSFIDSLNKDLGPHYSLTLDEAIELFSEYEIFTNKFLNNGRKYKVMAEEAKKTSEQE